MTTALMGGRSGRITGSITGMKVSVSLPDEDVAFVDEYAARTGIPSRSSVLQHAIGLLRTADLERAYEAAFDEWDDSADAALWDGASRDGLGDAAR
jgi:Arc/MetJ-type ribon-helix-helix transcriptional regulator